MSKTRELREQMPTSAQHLTYFLLRKKWTVNRFADAVQSSEQAVWNWIEGKCQPNRKYRQRILAVTGIEWHDPSVVASPAQAADGRSDLDALRALFAEQHAETQLGLRSIISTLVAVLTATNIPAPRNDQVDAAAQLFVEQLLAASDQTKGSGGTTGSNGAGS